MTLITITDIATNQMIARAGFCDSLSNKWGWIAETVAQAFECQPDQVDCIETDDGDRITANGVVVAYTH